MNSTLLSNDLEQRNYCRRGYAIFPDNDLIMQLVYRCKKRITPLLVGEYDTHIKPWRCWNVGDKKKIQKIDQVHLADHALHELVSHPWIGQLAARITGASKIQVWASQLFYKPAGGGEAGNIGWHTDQENWTFWQGEVFTAWLALSDIDEHCGALRFVERSHLWDKSVVGDAYYQKLEVQRDDLIHSLPKNYQWKEVPVIMPSGGISFHHSQTWHASGANEADFARCSLAINLRTENASPVKGKEDYGYCQYLNDPYVCPIIYDRNS